MPTWELHRFFRTDEEVEKLRWAERWGADTVMDLSTGGDLTLVAMPSFVTVRANRTVPIYSMIIGRRIEALTSTMFWSVSSIRLSREWITSRSMPEF